MNYTPLNIKTGYSFLSSALRIEDIFEICKKNSFPSFGVCDYNSMFSYSEINNFKKYNITPLFGVTYKVILNDYNLTLTSFIKNDAGYKNLIKIISLYPNGITLRELNNYKSGLVTIISSKDNVDFIKDLFLTPNASKLLFNISSDFDDFYIGIEIYSKNDINYADNIREYSKNHNYKCVTFNKHLYLEKSDAITLDILTSIKNDTQLEIENSEGPYFFLKLDALKTLYTDEEINNTSAIASLCSSFCLESKRGKLLKFEIQGNKKDLLYDKCLNRINELNLDKEKYLSRVNYELDIIDEMGYLDYFLIVEDYVKYSKNNGIPVGPGRGSSAGSLISYLLNITEVDSLKYDLLFERFLNPKRVSMPDIDIDFADYKREQVINYIQKKYGKEKTAGIITFQTFGPKAALRDIARIFKYDSRDINIISQAIGKYSTFEEAYHSSKTYRELLKDSHYKNIINKAKKIESLPRQTSIHPAGIIINDESLIDCIPVIKDENGTLISQFEAPFLEKLGFLKMDILGITNLTLLENMENYIKEYYNHAFSLHNISLNDYKTFNTLNHGFTYGIFQLERPGMTKALKDVGVNNFDDIVAVLALNRPGPMANIPVYASNKNNPKQIKYLHPSLEPILKSTYGVIVYQEQIMQIVQVIASFDLGKADLFRRAISKKDASKLAELKEDFINGALKNGYKTNIVEEIYNLIYKFADYGFNKSHSVSYAIISYQMAYIKANYPHAYYACILNNTSLSDPNFSSLQNELSSLNIKIKLPSITRSKDRYVISGNNLIIPFTLIKGLNKQIIYSLLSIQLSLPKSFEDFISYANKYEISEQTIITLINSGCFDEYEYNRQTMRHAVSPLLNYFKNISSEGLLTQEELLSMMPIINKYEDDLLLNYDLEYQTLGLLISGSILEKYHDIIKENNISSIISQLQNNNGKIAMIIKSVKEIKTKKGDLMAICLVQDDSYKIDMVLFPLTYQKYKSILKTNSAYIAQGSFNNRNNEISFVADIIYKLEEN